MIGHIRKPLSSAALAAAAIALAVLMAIPAVAPRQALAATTSQDPSPARIVCNGNVLNEHILMVDGEWAYCAERDQDFMSGKGVARHDGLYIINEDQATRVALADYYVWSLPGSAFSGYGSREKYYITQILIWMTLSGGYYEYPDIGKDSNDWAFQACLAWVEGQRAQCYCNALTWWEAWECQDLINHFTLRPKLKVNTLLAGSTYNGKASETIEVRYGSQAYNAWATGVCDGYEFLGVSSIPNGTPNIYDARGWSIDGEFWRNREWVFGGLGIDIVNAYCIYKPVEYNVRYVLGGGSFSGTQPKTTVGCSEFFRVDHPTRSGYTFTSWDITDMDTSQHSLGTDKSSSESASNVTALWFGHLRGSSGTVTFTARWESEKTVEDDPYTIRFHPNGASGSVKTQTCKRDAYYSLLANTFARTGFTFAGWNTAIAGTGTGYRDQQRVINLAPAGSSIDLYAQWEAIAEPPDDPPDDPPDKPQGYTIVYNANGGFGTMADQACTIDKWETLSPVAFSRANYSFKGWGTSPGQSSASYRDRASVRNLAPAGGSMTLYALWTYTYTPPPVDPPDDPPDDPPEEEPVYYTITFYADGSYLDSVSVREGTSYSIPASITARATRTNCSRFDGWYRTAGYTSRWSGGIVIGDMALYGRNFAMLTYDYGGDEAITSRYLLAKANGAERWGALKTLVPVPAAREYQYGTTVALDSSIDLTRVMFSDANSRFKRTLRAGRGWHAGYACTDSAFSTLTITRNTTVYKDWVASGYDGIDSGRR